MNATAPKIGFDRFIKGAWATMALDVRLGRQELGDVMALLEADGLSVAARKKVKTVLNRLWLEPREELANFVSRGVALHEADAPPMVLHWGVSIATYPFFAHVAEVVGRLTALQGDCAATEVHRRMSEVYGEREGMLLTHGRNVIESVEIRRRLQIGLVFDELFRTAMQETDMRIATLHDLAVHFQNQA